ncbi:hypothetical protein [Actinophytocola glycyrrhizae]|uniref:Uncharacterized protein n=1 Tax=Actinophytocola glycyrrhizae TaxID=2044873 RepID=A0ABV9SCT7_9PSEU
MQRFKKGICHLARRRPSVPIVPVYLHGCGRVLPKGAVLPAPLRCTAFVGTPVTGPAEDATRFVDELEATVTQLVDGTPLSGMAMSEPTPTTATAYRRGFPARELPSLAGSSLVG